MNPQLELFNATTDTDASAMLGAGLDPELVAGRRELLVMVIDQLRFGTVPDANEMAALRSHVLSLAAESERRHPAEPPPEPGGRPKRGRRRVKTRS